MNVFQLINVHKWQKYALRLKVITLSFENEFEADFIFHINSFIVK